MLLSGENRVCAKLFHFTVFMAVGQDYNAMHWELVVFYIKSADSRVLWYLWILIATEVVKDRCNKSPLVPCPPPVPDVLLSSVDGRAVA